jgi:succinyl-diaminopimelate desuccinylase
MLDNIMDNYLDEMVSTLQEVIRIPSKKGEPLAGMPFGEGPFRALEYMLAKGRELGFETVNVDGYAGHVEYGEGNEIIAVLGHLDVVPEGEGWTYPPYGGVIQNENVYGRGACDNKGACVASLYCLKALKDSGIMPNRRIRIIFGTDEETGMEDMTYYFKKQPLPTFGFSPDISYPIYHAEKGIMHILAEYVGDMKPVIELSSGDAYNTIPGEAFCILDSKGISEEERNQLKIAIGRLPDVGCRGEMEDSESGLSIRIYGRKGHGGTPKSGVNSAQRLMNMLSDTLSIAKLNPFFHFVRNKLGLEYSGELLEIATTDDISGELTVNVGIVNVQPGSALLCLDIRYPVTVDGQPIGASISKQMDDAGLNVTYYHDSAPNYVPAENVWLKRLQAAYEEITGEPAELRAMSGGTYARALQGRGVAYGGNFGGGGGHNADEFYPIVDLAKQGRICLFTLYKLACDDYPA